MSSLSFLCRCENAAAVVLEASPSSAGRVGVDGRLVGADCMMAVSDRGRGYLEGTEVRRSGLVVPRSNDASVPYHAAGYASKGWSSAGWGDPTGTWTLHPLRSLRALWRWDGQTWLERRRGGGGSSLPDGKADWCGCGVGLLSWSLHGSRRAIVVNRRALAL